MRNIIADRANLARNGFMARTLSRVSTGLRMPFVVAILPKPTIEHCQWDHGDGTSRALLAWMYLKDMVGQTPACQEIEAGLWSHLKSLVVSNTGMVCVPEHSDIVAGEYYYHMWDQGRFFDYLVQRYQHPSTMPTQRGELTDMVHALQKGVYALAVPCPLEDGRVGLKWDADVYWNETPGLPSDRDFGKVNFRNWCIVSSQLLGPQTQWAMITGSDDDLQKAIQLANGFVAGVESPRRGSTTPLFAETGEFKGHVHGTVSGLLGLVKLAKYLMNRNDVSQAEQWIDLAYRAYKWLFDSKHNGQTASSCGCVPEGMQLPHYSTTSEICCTADLIELAVELAECASTGRKWAHLADLWDDVERFVRNELMHNQFTDVSKIKRLLPESSDQSKKESVQILEKLVGVWVSSRTYLHELGVYRMNQNDPDFQMPVSNDGASSLRVPMIESGGCCGYSGIRGLYPPFMKAVVQDDCTTEIRIATAHDDDNVTIVEEADGEIRFVAHRECLLRFRRPSFAKRESICVQGDMSWSDDGRWAEITLKAGESGTITFEQAEWSVTEVFGPLNDIGFFSDRPFDERIECTLSYSGNELTSVEPAGSILPYEKGM